MTQKDHAKRVLELVQQCQNRYVFVTKLLIVFHCIESRKNQTQSGQEDGKISLLKISLSGPQQPFEK